MTLSNFTVWVFAFSRLSNKHVGWNKYAGGKIPPNLSNLGITKIFWMAQNNLLWQNMLVMIKLYMFWLSVFETIAENLIYQM